MRATQFLQRSWQRTVFALSLSLLAAAVCAQPAKKDFEPQVGQEGKDVIWVPTPQGLVDKMLDMAKVTSSDYVIDLGSGDGRTVITAAKRGARAQGIEYNPDMVELSTKNAEKAGVSDKAKFSKADIFESDFSQATVITMYLLPTLNVKLRPKILDSNPARASCHTHLRWKTGQRIRPILLTAVPRICGSYRQKSKVPGSLDKAS